MKALSMKALSRGAFFLSGTAALIFEIVWSRHLILVVGGTTLAVAVITAAYMAGLALGSALAGRFSDRLRRPLLAYGLFEIAIALMGAMVPALTRIIPWVDATLFSGDTSSMARALTRFFIASVLILLPTTAMGATLPVLARAVTQKSSHLGREVGFLYALNTAGALTGAALAGFWLIPNFGMLASNSIAVVLDLLIGVSMLAVGSKYIVDLTKDSTEPVPEAGSFLQSPANLRIFLVVALTGAAAMALQVLWTRALSTVLGPSTYAFSAIVCAYLLGLALGGVVASHYADKIDSPRRVLGVTLVLTTLAALFGIQIIDDLPFLLLSLVNASALSVNGLFQTKFAIAAFTLLPATMGMGAIFPLAISSIEARPEHVGSLVGRTYAFNTVGNILGSAASVFILLPLLGIEMGLRLAALLYVAAALLLLCNSESSMARKARVRGALIGLIALVMLLPSWDVGNWTAGFFRLSYAHRLGSPKHFEHGNLIFHRDGMSATVTVEEDGTTRWIKVNGKTDGSNIGDMPTQVLSGALPFLLHPTAKRAAVVGCGSAVTVGSALASPSEHVTLIEIEDAVLEGARFFNDVNHNPWDDPRLRLVNDDGRNFFQREETLWDIIISEPSNPWMTGAASLFTQEFFSIAANRLEKDGIFLQWLQTYELAPERIATLLRTFRSVFPHVLVFVAHADSTDFLLIGRQDVWSLDTQVLNERYKIMQDELQRADVHNLYDILARLLFDERRIQELPDSGPLNTDDNALIEFGAPRDLLTYADAEADFTLAQNESGRRFQTVKNVIKGMEKPENLTRLAWSYARQGMVNDAEELTKEIIRQGDPTASDEPADFSSAAFLLKIIENFDGDHEEVVFDKEKILLDKTYAHLVRQILRGEEEKALESLNNHFKKNNPEKSPDNHLLLLWAYLAHRDSDFKQARKIFEILEQKSDIGLFRRTIQYYSARNEWEANNHNIAINKMVAYFKNAEEGLPSPPEAN